MTLNKDNWNSPWGKPPSGGGGGNRGGSGGGNPPPPDFDELFRKSQERLKKMFPPPSGDGKTDWRPIKFMAAVVGVLWVFSGVYQVGTKELGVVTRFGAFSRTTPPGIHYHLPYPIEAVQTPEVTAVNRTEIGFVSSSARGGKPQSKPEESLMLTGDENIVDIQFEVQWRIATAQDYLFNIRNPEATVKAVAESAMREAVGQMDITEVLSGGEGKLKSEQETKTMMQKTLDSYGAGIEIVAINLTQPEPPAEVLDAWRDVQSARVDMETARNEALAYRNDIIPRARGQAEQIMQEAEAYKQQVVAKATGEASRFEAIYQEYKQAPAATSKRMYIETMEEVLKNMQKIIVDNKGGNGVLPFLPLNDLKPKASTEAKP